MALVSIIDEIFSAGKDINEIKSSVSGSTSTISSPSSRKSFAKGALDSTLQFPCLISDAIPIDMASTIARSLERVYASFVQTYLSMNNTIDISVDRNPNAYLKRFHRNVKLESTVEDLYNEYVLESDEDYDNLMKRIYDGTTKAYINESANTMIVFNFTDKFDRSVYESHKELLEENLKDLDFEPFPNVGNSPYYEALTPVEMHALDVKAAEQDVTSQFIRKNDELKQRGDLMKTVLTGDKLRVPSMTDNDVKKTNDMQPYLMQIRLMAVNDKNEFVQFMDFIVGVKVILHNIKSDEMITNLMYALQNSGKLFNFIRWTTGEKSLFKDLLFHLNDVKLDVANRSKGSSPWWTTLKAMKDSSNAQKAFLSRTSFVPNSTIVVSSYDVDTITKNFGYSLKDPRFAKQVMRNLFLMNFVIVDEGTRTVEILYDGENSYQTYALETLEREVTNNSNAIGKELTRMISR